jgi:putrescine aminotransferase
MKAPTEQILRQTSSLLELIAAQTLPRAQQEALVHSTVRNFAAHVNPGFLEYRKSITEAGDYAAVEWTGHGSIITDALGRNFIDCLGGFGIYSAGISNPRVVQAVRDQLAKMPLTSQELLDPLRAALGNLLYQITPGDLQYCFFTNSGTESIEGAMKVAKLRTGRSHFIAAQRGFHGKSLGSLSLMGKPAFREPFLPLLQPVTHVPFGDAEAVERACAAAEAAGQPVAGVVFEPIQGEAGAVVPPDDFWPAIRQTCSHYGALLIADEVQTGLGRTGRLFGVEHWDVVPDILPLAKALGGGVMPAGAIVMKPHVWEPFTENPFLHTTTFGGNPLACAAAIAAIHVTLDEDLPGQAAAKESYLLPKLQELAHRYDDLVVEARGKGLLLALEFHDGDRGYQVAAGLFRRGVLVGATLTNAQTIRIEPALAISYEQLDTVLAALEDALKATRRP